MAKTYDPAKDPYAQRSIPVNSYARNAFQVTPSDTNNLPTYAKALYIGTEGNIAVVPVNAADDTDVVTFVVGTGVILPIQVRRVMDTGTDAEDIVALVD